MINAYLPAYRKTLLIFYEAKKRPLKNKHLWLEIQERLIKSITRIENRIRQNRTAIKEIKAYLGDALNRQSKEDAVYLKSYAAYLKEKIEIEYRMLFLYRSIGDSIAFTFIDRHDIKPQSEKESAGFISGKKGNRAERKSLRFVFKAGGIAILNDLTNYLRFSDLTIINNYNDWFPIEIKSGRASANNARAKRQLETSIRQFEYIFNETILEIPETGWTRRRVSQTSKTKDYRKKFNTLIEKAKLFGDASVKMEDGLVYFASYSKDPPKDFIEEMNLSYPTKFFLNRYKDTETSLVPLLMNFDNCDQYLDFLRGDLVIIFFLEFEILNQHAKKLGYQFVPLEDLNFPYQLMPDNDTKLKINVSNFAISKIFFHLLSPKWWVNETICSLNHPDFTGQLSMEPQPEDAIEKA